MKSVQFPIDSVVQPGLFATHFKVGDVVWFFLKGSFVEGRVVGFWGQIIPYSEQKEGKPIAAQVSDISYAVQFWVPTPNGDWAEQVQLLEKNQMFPSFEALIENLKEHNTLRLPED